MPGSRHWHDARHGLARRRRSRPHQALRRGGRRGQRAPRRLARHRPGHVHRDHGPVRVRQVDPDARPRRPRPADGGHGRHRGDGDRRPRRRRPHAPAARQDRVRLPGLQPRAGADGRGEHPPPAHAGRPRRRGRARRAPARGRRARRPKDAPPRRAVGRPAAARRRGARARLRAGGDLRRRADRQPRLGDLRGDPRAAAARRRRVRPGRRHGHPRGDRGRDRRPRRLPRRRQGRRRRLRPRRRPDPRSDEGPGVTRLALRGLAARKLRTALTIVAVLLGVTMIAGTFVLTDTIKQAFDDIFSAQTKGADVIVSGRTQVESEFSTPRPLDAKLLDEIRTLPEVAQTAGQINDVAAVVGKDGKVVKTGGAPTIAATYMPKPFAPIGFSKGRAPAGAGEIALDAATAGKEGFELGDEVTVATAQPKRPFKLVGLATIGQSAGLGGATFVVFDLATAQGLFDKRGKVDFAFVAGRPGISQTDLKRQIAALLPPTAEVRTAAQEADKLGEDIREGLSFLTTGLLAFAFIAVLVGAFLIFNTFSITVAQRSRELALLRTLGATRRQVLRSVLLEALTIGLLGSLVGILAGLGFAKGINELFKALGVDLPTTSLVLESRTIIVCLLVGTLVTLAGALAPAVRATRVAPVEALREASAPTRGRLARLTPWLAGLLILGGAGLVVAGLLAKGGDTSTKLLGAAGGAVILILGIALMSPRFVGPAARIVAAPIERSTKLVGRLARENSTRHPGRTAVTSAALMVGLALVVFVTVFANGLRASIEDLIDRTLAGNIAVLHDDGFSPIPAAIGPAVAKVPGVAAVSSFRDTEAKIRGVGGTLLTHAIQPSTVGAVYNFDWKDGSDATLRSLGSDGVLLEENTATKGKFAVGDRIGVTGPSGSTSLVVRGIYK